MPGLWRARQESCTGMKHTRLCDMKGLSEMVAHLSMPGWWAACMGKLLWGWAAVASA